jgi:hypothetical protein
MQIPGLNRRVSEIDSNNLQIGLSEFTINSSGTETNAHFRRIISSGVETDPHRHEILRYLCACLKIESGECLSEL